jgi:hypothetical protein
MNEDWLSFSQKGEFQSRWRAGSIFRIKNNNMTKKRGRNTIFVHTLFWNALNKSKLRKDATPPTSEKKQGFSHNSVFLRTIIDTSTGYKKTPPYCRIANNL